MPNSGPVGVFNASPQSTAPAENFVGPIPEGPQPNSSPDRIVAGFLAASASYPTFAATAKQYLTGSVGRQWNPGWGVTVFTKLKPPLTTEIARGGKRATVDVTGTVQATYNGSGEFVSLQHQSKPTKPYGFSLVKVGGQWRISRTPTTRLLTEYEFGHDYKPQDLYFVNPNAQNPVLVPDSVFVPLGTSPTTLVMNLVNALKEGPKNTWLQDATTSFPAGTTLLGVTLEGATAVVNLGGTLARASNSVKELVSAQLLWTLAAPQASLSSPIQSVELEIDGQPWVPPHGTICGSGQSQSPVQNQAAYGCYDSYPATPASFSFVSGKAALSRCGWVQRVAANSIGPVVPVLGRAGGVLGGQNCQNSTFVSIGSHAVPSAQPRLAGAPAAVAVSPDGQYAAYQVPANGTDAVYIRALAGAAAKGANGIKPVQEQGVTSLGWDREDDLWFTTQSGVVDTVSATGQEVQVPYEGDGDGNVDVAALSVAPDGVRVALILRVGSQTLLELGAIDRSAPAATGQLGSPSSHPLITPSGVPLGPNLSHPVALTWYDADNLLVLAGTGGKNMLYEVPVAGQQASGPLPTPEGATSITAYGPDNALVAGLSTGKLAVSASLEGPWQVLGVPGQNPAYP
jgi:hypothetical protein